jgi:hypothetical protein
MQAGLEHCRQDHEPQEDQHGSGGRAEGAGGHLGAAVNQPAGEETETDRDQGAIGEPQDFVIEDWEAVGDNGTWSRPPRR